MVKLSSDLHLVQDGEISLFGLGGRDVSDGLQKASVVEPVDPFECRELDGLQRFPRSAPTDDLGLVKAVDGFGERVVIAVADSADGWFDASLNQAFGVFDRDILAAAVTVMDEPAAMDGPALVQGLLQRIEDEAGMGCPADPPADDPPGEGVDDEGDIDDPKGSAEQQSRTRSRHR